MFVNPAAMIPTSAISTIKWLSGTRTTTPPVSKATHTHSVAPAIQPPITIPNVVTQVAKLTVMAGTSLLALSGLNTLASFFTTAGTQTRHTHPESTNALATVPLPDASLFAFNSQPLLSSLSRATALLLPVGTGLFLDPAHGHTATIPRFPLQTVLSKGILVTLFLADFATPAPCGMTQASFGRSPLENTAEGASLQKHHNNTTELRVGNTDLGNKARSRITAAATPGSVSIGMHGPNHVSAPGEAWVWASGLTVPLIFGTTGTERARITPEGYFGIGIKTPSATLDLWGKNNSQPILRGNAGVSYPVPAFELLAYNQDGNNAGMTIQTLTSGAFKEMLRIGENKVTLNGSLCIGSTDSISQLNVLGSSAKSIFFFRPETDALNFGSFSSANGATIAYLGAGGGASVSAGSAQDFAIRAEFALILAAGGNQEALRILSNGKVYIPGALGLGTTAPLAALHIISTNTPDIGGPALYISTDNTDSQRIRIYTYGTNYSGGSLFDLGANSTVFSAPKHLAIIANGKLVFGTNDNTEALRITENGTDMTGYLSVGSIFTGKGLSDGDAVLELGRDRSGNGYAYIDLHSQNGTDYGARIIKDPGNGPFAIKNTNGPFRIEQMDANDIFLSTNGTDRVVITRNGNIGLGIPNPSVPLDVKIDSTYKISFLMYQNAAPSIAGHYLNESSSPLRISGLPLTLSGNGGNGAAHLEIRTLGDVYVPGPISVGVPTAASSAKLEVSSTTQGLLPPRMTTVQKNAIVSPAEGLLVYDTTLKKMCFWDSALWQCWP